jgi:hypothetical protein
LPVILRANTFPVGAAAGCDLLILIVRTKSKDRSPVGAAAGCDLLILIVKTKSKDRSLRQLLQVSGFPRD